MSDVYSAVQWKEYVHTRLAEAVDLMESGLMHRNKAWLERAREQLKTLLSMEPAAKKLLIRCLEALVVVDAGNALSYLHEALTLDEREPTVLNNLGFVHHKQRRDYDQAALYYRKCLDEDSNFSQAYLGLADIYQALGATHMQRSLLEKAAVQCPNDGSVLLALGTSMVSMKKDLQKAYANLARAGDTAGASVYCRSASLTQRAHIHRLGGDVVEAARLYKEAATAWPENQEAILGQVDIMYKNPLPGATKADVDQAAKDLLPKFDLTKVPERNMDASHVPKVGFLWNSAVQACFVNFLFELSSWDVVVYSTDLKAPGKGKWTQRTVRDLPAEVAAEVMRSDGLDVLVDLIGTGPGARADILAQRPAAAVRSLELLGLPERVSAGICYSGAAATSDVPFLRDCMKTEWRQGPLTLGYLGPLSFVSDECLSSWLHVLTTLPEARLVVIDVALDSSHMKEMFLKRVPSEMRKRFVCLSHEATFERRLKLYRLFDAYLAPFPACPHLQLFEALLMNIPALTRATVTRTQAPSPVDILSACGIASDTVAGGDADLARLAGGIRGKAAELGTRARMLASPLVARQMFVKRFEDDLMEAWVCS